MSKPGDFRKQGNGGAARSMEGDAKGTEALRSQELKCRKGCFPVGKCRLEGGEKEMAEAVSSFLLKTEAQ